MLLWSTSLKPSFPKLNTNKLANDPVALLEKSLSSTVSVGSCISLNAILGASSLKIKEVPRSMLAEPVLKSPSLSTIVLLAVKLIKLALLSVTASSGLLLSGCSNARIWSNVTVPEASTDTVNTKSWLFCVYPSTTPLLSDKITCSPVTTSIKPLSPPKVDRL